MAPGDQKKVGERVNPLRWRWRKGWVGHWPDADQRYRWASPDGRYEIVRRTMWWDVWVAGKFVAQVRTARLGVAYVAQLEDGVTVGKRSCL